MERLASRKARFSLIILAYPVALIIISVLANLFIFGVTPPVVAVPDQGIIAALAVSAVLLLANHTWLMTSTELTRLKYNMHATPEEWNASDHARSDVTAEGLQELERRHNAHTNTTENVVYFVFLAALASVISPVLLAIQVWVVGFAIGRIGHSLSYLAGYDGLRGLFMSVSLAALYGLASYLVISLLI